MTRTQETEPIAHVAEDGRLHSLSEHLREVARRARENASAFGGGDCAEIAGLWHDLGKYAEDFQQKLHAANALAREAHIEGENQHELTAKKRVDHSTAGGFHAALRTRSQAHPIAMAIAGHHAGLADFVKLQERFADRGEKRLAVTLDAAPPEDILNATAPVVPKSFTPANGGDHDGRRSAELFTRMLFSALCDADFVDTEAFFDAGRTALRGGHMALGELSAQLTASIDALASADTEVNRVRAEVRAACVTAATRARGVFTLTVPTGGGKTLSAMELALRHALHHGMRRIVVAIPFTSILEQNAAVYRSAFKLPKGDNAVLEHHSAVDPKHETRRSRIACENWDAPVVVTTNVQLLESLFARRTSACRKLHNLARSVIILDEAQTLPRGLLAPTTDVLEALVRDYGCTIILSTATQPALTRAVLRDCGLAKTCEVIPDPQALAERLRRVDVDWSGASQETTWGALAATLASEPDVLAIVHRRDDARALCTEIDLLSPEAPTVHLSALMCPAHRTLVLADIRQRKLRGEPVRVVSTQLVEAGVDLDFPVVYRALGGLDSLTQAAGRCNREGRLPRRGVLYVYLAPTRPPQGILQQGFEIARTMLKHDLDLFAPAVHAEYFQRLYNAGGDDVHDERDIQRDRAALSFEKVAASYRIIDDDWSAPVVVPYDDRARRALAEIERSGPSRDRLRELGRVTVNVSKKLVDTWLRSGAILTLGDGTVHALASASAYDPRFGLLPERVGTLAPSESVL